MDKILNEEQFKKLNRSILKYSANNVLSRLRLEKTQIDASDIFSLIKKEYENLLSKFALKKVINATGVILHTNLGRSPIEIATIVRATEKVARYSNLEYDIENGARAERYSHAAFFLKLLTSSQDAVVVNNNAAALFLVANTFSKNKKTVVARAELSEIGGRFRILDMLESAQAKVEAVGAVNKVYLSDYETSLGRATALILKVSKSNFELSGFVNEVGELELLELSRKYKNRIFYFDAGSLSLEDFENNSKVSLLLKEKNWLISFSGDKMLGANQSGIILGSHELIDKLKKNPIIRTLRPDKFALAILEESLLNILNGEETLLQRLVGAQKNEILEKSENFCKKVLAETGVSLKIVEDTAVIGGGAGAEKTIESFAVVLPKTSGYDVSKIFRELGLPIILKTKNDETLLSLHAVFEDELGYVLSEVCNFIKKYHLKGNKQVATNDWKDRFRAVYRPLLKENYDKFENALNATKNKHLRVTEARQIDYLEELGQIATLKKLDKFRGVYSIEEEKEKITASISFQTGGCYIMNPSSVIPAQILATHLPNEPIVLDVSSAPGGKTCALSDFTKRRGVIIANEISSQRQKSLHFNLEKYGCYNVRTTSMDGRLLGEKFEEVFDGILLDAPCSNENKIFRDKVVQAQWSKDLVDRMAKLQRELLLSSFKALKKGGVLVYSTCTLSIEENELNVKFLLDNAEEAYLISCQEFAGGGLSGNSYIDENVARVMPDEKSIDGFFIATIGKKGERFENDFFINKIDKKISVFLDDKFSEFPKNVNFFETEGRGYIETSGNIFNDVRFKRRGLNIYKQAGDNFELSSQALWEFGSFIKSEKITQIPREDALKYLKGFDIETPIHYNDGLLFVGGLPVGCCKKIGDVLKNKLDRYFLYGKNIEW